MATRRFAPLALALLGCTSGGSSRPGAPPATAILVEPAAFLGAVPCVDAPGGMRRYVATLFDVSPRPTDATPADEVTLPSAEPAPCHLGVRFTLIQPGRRYVAEIDGYDADELVPLAPGSRVMLDADGAVAPPRWTTTCGRGPGPEGDGGAEGGSADSVPRDDGGPPDLTGPVYAVERATIPIRGCLPLEDTSATPGVTAVVVDPARALGGRLCGLDAGGVGAVSITVRETGEVRTARCDEALTFSDLTDGVEYHFDVTAVDPSAEGGAASTLCYRVAQEGLTLTAACDPL